MEQPGSRIEDVDDVLYQVPVAYLLGVQGVALLRAFCGEYGREFTEARLAEIRALLDAPGELRRGTPVASMSVADGYDDWAGSYDQPGNAMIDREEPIVHEILAGLPVGVALDVACGTGRHAAHLASLGHRVTGVDASPGMLAAARAKVPDGEFRTGDLHELPVADGQIDVVVCGLALTHVRDLAPVFAEFARVLRPGGHLVISDIRGLLVDGTRYPLLRQGPGGRPGFVQSWVHPTSAFLQAALPLGLQVRRCEEPRQLGPMVRVPADADPIARPAGTDGPPSIWELHPRAPEATNAAYRDQPHFIVWHFQLAGS
jgi:SAM-dependent methyltransferase